MIHVQHVLALTAGIPIGFQLDMTETGGALLAVPLLVYVVGMSVQEAAAISLVWPCLPPYSHAPNRGSERSKAKSR